MTLRPGVEFTTEHPCSHYGIPVLLIDGQAYGPADSIEHTPYAEAGGTAGTAAYYACAMLNSEPSDELRKAVTSFCTQWPEGPQPDAK